MTTGDIKLFQFAAKKDGFFFFLIQLDMAFGEKLQQRPTDRSCRRLSNNEPIFAPLRIFHRIISRTTE